MWCHRLLVVVSFRCAVVACMTHARNDIDGKSVAGFWILIGQRAHHEYEDYVDESATKETIHDDGTNPLSRDQGSNKYKAVASLLATKAKDELSKATSLKDLLALAAAAGGDEAEEGKEDGEDADDSSSDGGSSSLDESEGDARANLFGSGSTPKKSGGGSSAAAKTNLAPKPIAKAAEEPGASKARWSVGKLNGAGGKSSKPATSTSQTAAASPPPSSRTSKSTNRSPVAKSDTDDRLGGGQIDADVHHADGRFARILKGIQEKFTELLPLATDATELEFDDDVTHLGDSKGFKNFVKAKVKACQDARGKIKLAISQIDRASSKEMLKDERDRLTTTQTRVEAGEKVLKLMQAGKAADYLEIESSFTGLPEDMVLSDVYYSVKLARHVHHLASLGRFDHVCTLLSLKGTEVLVIVQCLHSVV